MTAEAQTPSHFTYSRTIGERGREMDWLAVCHSKDSFPPADMKITVLTIGAVGLARAWRQKGEAVVAS